MLCTVISTIYIYVNIPILVGSVHIADNIIKRLGDIDNVIWAH